MVRKNAYDKILAAIAERYRAILKDTLIGIYVHGSIAFGCFTWERSDIDFIVVVDHPLSQPVKLYLLEVLEELRPIAPPKGFEMSVVLQEHCARFVHPTPYELHFSNGWLARYLDNPLSLCGGDVKTDFDLAAHFTVLLRHGIVLHGPPIAEVFGPVPQKHYLDSICLDVENAKEDIAGNPAYVVLNLCRVLAFCEEGLVLSKAQGGEWGIAHTPLIYRGLIADALAWYAEGTAFPSEEESLRIAFCEYMLGKIQRADG